MQPNPMLVFDGPADARRTIALAHGAGAGMDTPFMNVFAAGLAGRGFRVARFEFPYMANFRDTGNKRAPDREPILRESWLKVVELLGPEHLVIGGKSLGGRMASMVADEARTLGLVCLGYPFHPVGKPERLRVAHLKSIRTPTLILQGSRDPFGNRAEVANYDLSAAIKLHWLEDGNHDFTPRKASGHTQQGHWDDAIAAIARFVDAL